MSRFTNETILVKTACTDCGAKTLICAKCGSCNSTSAFSRDPSPMDDLSGYKVLSSTDDGTVGIKILVRTKRDTNEQDDRAGYRLMRELGIALDMETARLDPKTEVARIEEKADIEKCFTDASFPVIFMEPCPNEYFGDKDPMSLRSPWYIVTTHIGHFKVGWRKRVLVIDWERTTVKVTANGLFPLEDVTRGEHMLHAWGYTKATEYLSVIRKATTWS